MSGTRTTAIRDARRAHSALRWALWGGLLLLHTPLLARVLPEFGSSGDATFRGLLLFLSQCVFALKLVDVPWLRLPHDRRLIGLVAAGVLLHAGVFVREKPQEAIEFDLVPTVAIAGGATVALLGGLLRLFQHRRGAPVAPRSGRSAIPAIQSFCLVWQRRFHDWLARSAGLPAPPSLI